MIETRELPSVMEPTTPIKPSEALRLGCLLYPVQAFGDWFDGNAACALGAMQAGFGGGPDSAWADDYRAFRQLSITVPSGEQFSTGVALMYLNDGQKWSREQIADWLESKGL